MKNLKDYQSEVNKLRKEIVNSIINLLKEHGLEELELDEDLDDLCYVVWFDNDGYAYDSPVRKVSLDENGVCLDVRDQGNGYSATLCSGDLGCQNLDWLCRVFENMLDTFEELNNEDNL